VINELRDHHNKKSYLELLDKMTKDGYQLYALYDEQIVTVTDVTIRTNFYYSKHIFIYDLVTRYRACLKGYGERLLAYIHKLAKENECQMVALESSLQRVDAHRFIEYKMDYKKFYYSFKKVLE
jgi:hypothetical protein